MVQSGVVSLGYFVSEVSEVFLTRTTIVMPRKERIPKTTRIELTPAQRSEILGARRMGHKIVKIQRVFGHPYETIRRTIKNGNERQNTTSSPRARPRKTTGEVDELIAEAAIAAPHRPLRELNVNIASNVSKRTVQRRLREKGIKKHRQRKKPRLKAEHRQKRLCWALDHELWTEVDFNNVVFSDECSIELGSGEATPFVFRLKKAPFTDVDAQEKQPKGPRVMLWAAFHGTTKSEAVILEGDPESPGHGITAQVYLECLKAHLPPLMEGGNKIFMHDNASIHTAGIVSDWLREKGYRVMVWPPYSPDLNPIEHCWFPTKAGVHPLTSTILEVAGVENQRRLLGGEAIAAWDRISPGRLQKLVKTMDHRVKAVIRAQGGHTKY